MTWFYLNITIWYCEIVNNWFRGIEEALKIYYELQVAQGFSKKHNHNIMILQCARVFFSVIDYNIAYC